VTRGPAGAVVQAEPAGAPAGTHETLAAPGSDVADVTHVTSSEVGSFVSVRRICCGAMEESTVSSSRSVSKARKAEPAHGAARIVARALSVV
jgi:hypothetical protein